MSNHEYLKSICLLGSDRKSIYISELSGYLEEQMKDIQTLESPEVILHALSLNHYYNQAAKNLPSIDKVYERPPIQEYIQYAPPACYSILDKIRNVEKRKIQILLVRIWNNRILRLQRIVHPMHLVGYFNLLLQCPKDVRANALPLFGEKGKWLIGQHDKYQTLRFEIQEDVWNFGKAEDRSVLLTDMLQTQPAEAIKLLSDNWDTETAKEKLRHLKTILHNMSEAAVPFLENLYENEFSFSDKESKTSLHSRATIAKALLLSQSSHLHKLTVQRLSKYIPEAKGGFLSKVFQSKGEVIEIPERDDDFFNADAMCSFYGIDPNSKEISNFHTDQLFWFSHLCSAIPFYAWSTLTGRKASKIIDSFFQSEQFTISVKSKKQSCLKQSLIELASYHKDDDYILNLLSHLKEKESFLAILPRLSAKSWEKYISENADLVDNSVLQDCPHTEGQSWSKDFSKGLIDFIIETLKTRVYLGDYHIGITLAQYLHNDSLEYLTKMNASKALESPNYTYWKNHIFDPIYETIKIRIEIEQL